MADANFSNNKGDASISASAEPHLAARKRRRDALFVPVLLIVLAGVICHVHVQISPRVIFYGDMVELPDQQHFATVPIFVKGTDFFASFLDLPGGLAEWAGAGLTQYFSISAFGTAVLVLLAAMVYVVTNRLASALSGRPARYTGFLPALILIVIYGRYVFHLGDILAVCGALAATEAYLRLRRPIARAIAIGGGTLALYYVFGAPAMLFAGLCGLMELLRWRNWALTGLAVAIGAAAPALVGMVLLNVSAADAYARMSGLYHHWEKVDLGGPHWTRIVSWACLYGSCLLAVVVGWLGGRWARTDGEATPLRRRLQEAIRPVRPFAVLCSLALVAFMFFDARSSSFLKIHCSATHHQWQDVLDEAGGHHLKTFPAQTLRHINRALFETGRLADSMFAYPQSMWSLFASPVHLDQSAAEPETLMRLGMVNKAEHAAMEVIEAWGPRPTLLRTLARIFIVKGQVDAAKVFLHRLTSDIHYGGEAEAVLAVLAVDPTLSSDPDIRHIRSVMWAEDIFDPGFQESLITLLEQGDRPDRMVFEYLMGAYLLHPPRAGGSHEMAWCFDSMVRLLAEHAHSMSYQVLPKHYAEAVVLQEALTGDRVPLGDLAPAPETAQRFRRSISVMGNCRFDVADADAVLAEEMPNSYFRYIATGQSGRATCD